MAAFPPNCFILLLGLGSLWIKKSKSDLHMLKFCLVSMWDAFCFHISASAEPAGFWISPHLEPGCWALLILLK